jgi:uncharacterized membrane protein SpoIIM required for sporulation
VDEQSFVEQKKQSWERLSESLDRVRLAGAKSLTPDQLRSLGAGYRSLVSDLSFVRTQGASEGLISYLNELAGRAHGVVYVSRSAKLGGVVSFVFRDFPALFRRTINYTLVAAMIFAIGWAVSATSPEVRDMMLPGEIAKPAKGTGSDSQLSGIDPSLISSFIMVNNITVGIHAFAGGITAGAYTVYELAQNGLVIGAVASKAAPVLGAARFWSLILPHGVIELMAIFICGAAGLFIGASIVAPGNLRRVDSIRLAAGTALKLFAGAVLLFVIAGIIEGFITPSGLPASFKLSFAGLTAIGLAFYLGLAGRGATTARRS